MNTVIRDWAIVGLLVVAALLWKLYALVTRRGRRISMREQREVTERHEAETGAILGLAQYASVQGWDGPLHDLGNQRGVPEYVQAMLPNLWGSSRSSLAGTDVHVTDPRYANVYSGKAGSRDFLVGNVWMGLGGVDRPGSITIVHLGEVLPPLFVNLRRAEPFMRFAMKEVTFESDAFNQRFRVMALNREYAMDVISERTMEILLERDDWVFFLEFDKLVCLAKGALQTVDDYTARLDAVTGFADQIPRFVEQDRAAQMPKLPDGTALDPEDPASIEKFKAALVAMSPQERQDFLAQVRVEGAKFLAGMFGKNLPPGMEERLREATLRSEPRDPTPRDDKDRPG